MVSVLGRGAVGRLGYTPTTSVSLGSSSKKHFGFVPSMWKYSARVGSTLRASSEKTAAERNEGSISFFFLAYVYLCGIPLARKEKQMRV